MVINVMLDTNILHSEGLMSVSMQRLLRLVKSGDLKIIIPGNCKRMNSKVKRRMNLQPI